VYSLAATLYKMVTGKTPPDALERRAKIESTKKDMIEDPRKLNKDVSLRFENAVMNALNVRIEDRTKDISQFIQELTSEVPVKRRYGKIKRIDFYRWPLWLKIAAPGALILLLAFGLLLAVGVIRFKDAFSSEVVLQEGYGRVPNVLNMDKKEAAAVLEEAGFNYVYSESVVSEYLEKNIVISQDPGSGGIYQKNSIVSLVICEGDGSDPGLLYKTEEEIKTLLEESYITYTIEQDYSNTDEGLIFKILLEDGTEVEYLSEIPEGSSITIYVSLGLLETETSDVNELASGTLSIEDTEMYSLYIDYLYEHQDDIEACYWFDTSDLNSFGTIPDSEFDLNLSRNCVLCDVTGDELPELVVAMVEQGTDDNTVDGEVATLHVLMFNPDTQALDDILTIENCDNSYGNTIPVIGGFCLLKEPNGELVYIYSSAVCWGIEVFTYGFDGSSMVQTGEYIHEFDEDGYVGETGGYINDTPVDEDTLDSSIGTLINEADTLVMSSQVFDGVDVWGTDLFAAVSSLPCNAMNYGRLCLEIQYMIAGINPIEEYADIELTEELVAEGLYNRISEDGYDWEYASAWSEQSDIAAGWGPDAFLDGTIYHGSFQSYTGAIFYYYTDASTGLTYKTLYVPSVGFIGETTEEEIDTGEAFYIQEYLN